MMKAEYELIEGAAGQIPPILAGDLKRPVLLNSPVEKVTQEMVGEAIEATVRTSGGTEFRARNVVVATSPYLSGRIEYDPPLGWQRQQLNQHKPMGIVAKALIEYETPLWEGSGFTIKPPEEGMLTICVDSTDPRNDKAVYVCLITGKQYDQYAAYGTNEAREEAVLQELTQTLGDGAKSPLSVDLANWPANPWVQGSYSSYWPPQAWTRFGEAFLRPEGVIQWCSTEYGLKWHGYFEGAITAAEEAARKVIAGEVGELRKPEPYITRDEPTPAAKPAPVLAADPNPASVPGAEVPVDDSAAALAGIGFAAAAAAVLALAV